MKFLLAALFATVAFGADEHLHGTCHTVADADDVSNDTTDGDEATCCGDAGADDNTCEGDDATKTFTPRCGATHTGLMGGDAVCCHADTANANCWSAEGTCDLAGDDAPTGCAAAAVKMDAACVVLQASLGACATAEAEAAAAEDDADERRRLEEAGEERDVSCYVTAMVTAEAACDEWFATFDDVSDARIKEVTEAQIGKAASDNWYADGQCQGMVANMNRNGWLAAFNFDAHDLTHLTEALTEARTAADGSAADGSADDGSAASSAAILSAAAALVAFAL